MVFTVMLVIVFTVILMLFYCVFLIIYWSVIFYECICFYLTVSESDIIKLFIELWHFWRYQASVVFCLSYNHNTFTYQLCVTKSFDEFWNYQPFSLHWLTCFNENEMLKKISEVFIDDIGIYLCTVCIYVTDPHTQFRTLVSMQVSKARTSN